MTDFTRCKNCETLVWETETHQCTEFRVRPVEDDDVVSVWVNTSVMGGHEYAAERWAEMDDKEDSEYPLAKGGGDESIDLQVWKKGEMKYKIYRVTGEFRPHYRSEEL